MLEQMESENSTSSWADFERWQVGDVKQNFRVMPMEEHTEVRFLLDFIHSVGQLGDLWTVFMENHCLELCMKFVTHWSNVNVRLLMQVVKVAYICLIRLISQQLINKKVPFKTLALRFSSWHSC